jgi:hypothetical protein
MSMILQLGDQFCCMFCMGRSRTETSERNARTVKQIVLGRQADFCRRLSSIL